MTGIEAVLHAVVGQDVAVEFDRGDADDPWFSAVDHGPFWFSGVITDVFRDTCSDQRFLYVDTDDGMAFAVAEDRQVRISASDIPWDNRLGW